MRARDEIRLIVAALLLNQLVLAFASIALMTRMTPAIEEIIVENVVSIEAVEVMLGALASPDRGSPSTRDDFMIALEHAETNVTEDSERPHIATLRQRGPLALSGDTEALRQTVDSLRELGRVNVTSVRAADQNAKRLGAAGAWTAAFLGALGFVLSVLAVRRVTRRFVEPLDDLALTVEAYRTGDVHRRFSAHDAPTELQRIGETVNGLLLDKLATPPERGASELVDRAATLFFLDALPNPAALLGRDGGLLAANLAGADRMRANTSQVHAAIEAAGREQDPTSPITVRDVRGAAWLVEWTDDAMSPS